MINTADSKGIQTQIFQYLQECCLGAIGYWNNPLDTLSHVGTEHGCKIITLLLENFNIGIERLILDHEDDIGVFFVVERGML
jgi:hypothetical protein